LLFAAGFISCLSTPVFASYEDGVQAYKDGKYAEAIKLFNAAKATDFRSGSLHYYLANALVRVNSKAEALKEYKLALDLEPESQIAAYCQAAISSLAQPPARPAGEKGLQPASQAISERSAPPTIAKMALQTREANRQPPQVLVYLCGCPLCPRIDAIITSLEGQYGDKVNFIRKTLDSQNQGYPNTRQGSQFTPNQLQYGMGGPRQLLGSVECPSISLIGERGGMAGELHKNATEGEIREAIANLAQSSDFSRMANTKDSHLLSTRNDIVNELNARISADRVRVNSEIKALRQAYLDQLQQNRFGRNNQLAATAPNRDESKIPVDIETQAKINSLEAEFDRRKREWRAEAEKRLQALGLKSTAGDLFHPFEQ
jgi:tetratricopeptide (TPR) repeat protein